MLLKECCHRGKEQRAGVNTTGIKDEMILELSCFEGCVSLGTRTMSLKEVHQRGKEQRACGKGMGIEDGMILELRA